MNPLMNVPHETAGLFKLGDKVRVKYGWAGVVGEIIEDYGNIGQRGRRMYTVRWKIEDEPELAEREDDLERVSD